MAGLCNEAVAFIFDSNQLRSKETQGPNSAYSTNPQRNQGSSTLASCIGEYTVNVHLYWERLCYKGLQFINWLSRHAKSWLVEFSLNALDEPLVFWHFVKNGIWVLQLVSCTDAGYHGMSAAWVIWDNSQDVFPFARQVWKWSSRPWKQEAKVP
jgi:hypothetical protein